LKYERLFKFAAGYNRLVHHGPRYRFAGCDLAQYLRNIERQGGHRLAALA
jgi:hypothetical protein